MFEDSINDGTILLEESQTESEIDEDEQERQTCLKSTQVTIQGFRSYLNWYTQHKVAVETTKTGWVNVNNESREIDLNDLLSDAKDSPKRQRRKCYIDRGSSDEGEGSNDEELVEKPEKRKF